MIDLFFLLHVDHQRVDTAYQVLLLWDTMYDGLANQFS